MKYTDVIIDHLNENDKIFEEYAKIFENADLNKQGNIYFDEIKFKIELLERSLQDLTEKITPEIELEENIYNCTIQSSKAILKGWFPILNRDVKDINIFQLFDAELQRLILYSAEENVESKNINIIKKDFDTLFFYNSKEVQGIIENERKYPTYNYNHENNDIDYQIEDRILYLLKYYEHSKIYGDRIKKIVNERNNYFEIKNNYDQNIVEIYQKGLLLKLNHIIGEIAKYKENKRIIDTIEPVTLNEFLESIKNKNNVQYDNTIPNENTIYLFEMNVCINSNDANEANKFIALIASILSSIDNVDIKIIEAGVSSFWQRWKIRIVGWFAKEEMKQVLVKSKKAVESYSLDRHIEPIEKSKSDRLKTEAEIKRMMSEDDVKIYHSIQLEKEKEELKSLKISNKIKELEYFEKLSRAFATGLVEVDSDYRILLNNLLLVKKEDGIIEFGNLEEIDSSLENDSLDNTETKEEEKL